MRKRGADDPERSIDIGFDRPIEEFRAEVKDTRHRMLAASIGDDDVKTAQPRNSFGDEAFAKCFLPKVVEQTYYRWRKEYGGLKVDQAQRLKELEQMDAGSILSSISVLHLRVR